MRELDFFGIYHLSRRGELELVAKPKGRPNGIAISPNGGVLYVTNSDERNVRAYDLDHNGVASNERILVSNIEGVPDGVRVDEKGNLYVAAGKLEAYTPEGKPLGSVPLAETPSNCAFGDADLQDDPVALRLAFNDSLNALERPGLNLNLQSHLEIRERLEHSAALMREG